MAMTDELRGQQESVQSLQTQEIIIPHTVCFLICLLLLPFVLSFSFSLSHTLPHPQTWSGCSFPESQSRHSPICNVSVHDLCVRYGTDSTWVWGLLMPDARVHTLICDSTAHRAFTSWFAPHINSTTPSRPAVSLNSNLIWSFLPTFSLHSKNVGDLFFLLSYYSLSLFVACIFFRVAYTVHTLHQKPKTLPVTASHNHNFVLLLSRAWMKIASILRKYSAHAIVFRRFRSPCMCACSVLMWTAV